MTNKYISLVNNQIILKDKNFLNSLNNDIKFFELSPKKRL